MKFTIFIPFILGAALQAFAQESDAARAAELVADLKRAPSKVARLNILANNRDVSTTSWEVLILAADGRIQISGYSILMPELVLRELLVET
jgi:hypothetical protein